MKFHQVLGLLFIPVSLAGCSTNGPDDLGTQTGKITEVFSVGVEPADFPDCRVPLQPEQISSGQYMQVQFRSYRLHRSINVFVPLPSEFKKGDKVVVNHPYCVGSHKPEITGLSTK